MALYVTLREGATAANTEPVLATGDQRVVQAVLNALAVIAREAGVKPAKPRRTRRTPHIYQLSQGRPDCGENDD